jgi:uncharacterized protein (TIGR03067 family)
MSREDIQKQADESRKKLEAIYKDIDRQAIKILDPRQADRVKQLQLQKEAGWALTHEDVAKKLGLKDDQIAKIKKLQDMLTQLPGPTSPNARMARFEKTRIQNDIIAVLTVDQTAAWKKMQGEPLTFAYVGPLGSRGGGGAGKTGLPVLYSYESEKNIEYLTSVTSVTGVSPSGYAESPNFGGGFPSRREVTYAGPIAKNDHGAATGARVLVRLMTTANASPRQPKENSSLLLPQTALCYRAAKLSVYVVGEKNIVTPKTVESYSGMSGIVEVRGVTADDVVVADASLVKPGITIQPDFIAGALEGPSGSIEFDEKPLTVIVKHLEDAHHIQIKIDERALAAAGVKSDVPCTIYLHDVTLATALRLLLRSVGLGYVAKDDCILITLPGKEPPKGNIPSETPASGSPAAELNALQGVWSITAVDKGKDAGAVMAHIFELGDDWGPESFYRLDFGPGRSWPGYPDTSLAYHFDPRRVWPRPRDDNERFLYYRINPTISPKTMDILSFVMEKETRQDTVRAVAIYELLGDHLKIAMRKYSSSIAGDQRPKEFAAGPDSDVLVLHLDRYRPTADDKAIQATWEVVKQVDNGMEASSKELRGRSYEFADYYAMITDPSREEHFRQMPAKWAIDSSKEPKTISILSNGWPPTVGGVKWTPKPLEFNGIYQFDGDKLTIAYRQNAPSPEKFESASGSGVTLLVLQKIKPKAPAVSTKRKQQSGSAGPPPTVRVTQPVVCDVCDYEEYTGRIEKGVVDLPVVEGFSPTSADASSMVKEGDILAMKADPEYYSAHESLNTAEKERKEAVSRTKDPGLLAAAEAKVKSAREALDRAKREHPPERIVAPFAGKVERRWNSSGDLSSLSITVPDSLILSFDVPERVVLEHRRATNRKPGWERSLPVVFALADEKGFPHRAKVFSVADDIDPKTHTQRWQAIVPNKDGLFLPGMSVRVRVITSEPHKVLLISEAARCFKRGGGIDVYVVNDRNVLAPRAVKLGHWYDGFVSVEEGLGPGDWLAFAVKDDLRPWVTYNGSGDMNDLPSNFTVKPDKVTTPPPSWVRTGTTVKP